MFCEVTRNTELINTGPLFLWDVQRPFPASSGLSIFIYQRITLLAVCFWKIIVYLYCWFINIELSQQHYKLIFKQSLPNTCIFSYGTSCPLALRNTRRHFSTTRGGHFKQWNHQKKHKCAKKHGTIDCLDYEGWNWKAEHHPARPGWERARHWPPSATSTDLGIIDTFQWVGRYTNMWIMRGNSEGLWIMRIHGIYARSHTHKCIVLCVLVLFIMWCKTTYCATELFKI